MTVVSQTTRVRYSGTSVPAEEYPVTFTFDYAADLEVIHTDSSGTDTTLTLTTHYTVSGGSGSTGTVTVTDSDYRAGTGEALTIRLNLDIEQQTDLVDNAALSASVLETQFDRNVRVMQQLQEQIDRSVKVGVTSATDPDDLVDIIETSVVSCAASAAAASSSASSASDSADAAAASAASVDLPTLVANRMLVANDTPEWELQSFDEVLTTLGGGDFGIDMFKATTSSAGATLFGLGEAATADLADQATAEAGTDNTDVMTPLRVSQLITALLASEAQAEAGTDNATLMTPLRVADAIAALASVNGWGYVGTVTASGDSLIEITDLEAGAVYEFVFDRLKANELYLQIYSGGAYVTTNYYNGASGGSPSILISDANCTTEGIHGSVYVHVVSSGASPVHGVVQEGYATLQNVCGLTPTGTPTKIKLFPVSGTLTGTVTVLKLS